MAALAGLVVASCSGGANHPRPDGGGDASAGLGTGGSDGATTPPPDSSADSPRDVANPPPLDAVTHDTGANQNAQDVASSSDGAAPNQGGQPDSATPDTVMPDASTPDLPTCPADCTQLPHVRPGAFVSCVAGSCQFSSDACEVGYHHCGGDSNAGCETKLSTMSDCGYCGDLCPSDTSECLVMQGFSVCSARCPAATPDRCGFGCTDFTSDPGNCGQCGNSCNNVPNGQAVCHAGTCTVVNCVAGWADCSGDSGCETLLGQDDNCGGCGDKKCDLANTFFTCSDGPRCDSALCAPGYANCDTTTPDCESSFTATASCMPVYTDTFPIPIGYLDPVVTALAADGSVFLGGHFDGATDFNPTLAGKDVRVSTDSDAFITKLNGDGSYAWTAAFSGRGGSQITGLAVTPAGAVVAVGTYADTIDLDPSATADVHQTVTPEQVDPFVVELDADGQLAWRGTFPSVTYNSPLIPPSVAVDSTGAVFVGLTYSGTIDADPGPGTSSHSNASYGGTLVKLSAATGALQSARFYDNDLCSATLQAVAVANDGSVWAVGTAGTGPDCPFDKNSDTQQLSILVVKHDAANTPIAKWTLDSNQVGSQYAIAAGKDGAVYISGTAGQIDFDPGPGVVHRWLGGYTGAFILKLDASAGYRWVRALPEQDIGGVAAAPDGGVIAVGKGTSPFVTRLDPDGNSIWTFAPPPSFPAIYSIASAGSRFAVASTSSGTVDMDPGPSIDPVYGDIAYVSRFSF